MQRAFTTSEVDALIPTLEELVARQLGWAREISTLLKTVQSKTGVEVSSMDELVPKPGDAAELLSAKNGAREAIIRYEDGWTDVQDLGAVVKDPRAGVLDFWGLHEGRYVWLQWGYGDKNISYFHETDAPMRKPIGRHTSHGFTSDNISRLLN